MKLKNKFAILLMSAFGLFCVSSNAFSFTLLNSYWLDGRTTFIVNLPAGTENQALFSNAFQEAVEAWNSSSTFIFDTDTGVAPIDPCLNNQGVNSVAFTSDVCGTAFGSGTLAVTLTTSFGDATSRSIILFDESEPWDVYNGPRFGPNGFRFEFDFRRVAVHEVGHALGLDHSTVEEAVMYPFVTDVETPQADDLLGVAARYDLDNDNIGLAVDNCPDNANESQSDLDLDNVGDACDPDADNDGVFNGEFVDQSFEIDNTISDTGLSNFFIFGNFNTQVRALAQTFEMPIAGTLNSVRLPIIDCDGGTLTIQIRSLDGENPSEMDGSVLQEAEFPTGDFSPLVTENGLLVVDFPPRTYPAGQRLALVAEHNNNNCGWLTSQASPLPAFDNGSARFLNGIVNPTWFELGQFGGDADLPFETMVTPTVLDNCPAVANSDQSDRDNDGIGDVCDDIPDDSDGDSIPDGIDNCPMTTNMQQLDSDENGVGDACQTAVEEGGESMCAPIRGADGQIALICF